MPLLSRLRNFSKNVYQIPASVSEPNYNKTKSCFFSHKSALTNEPKCIKHLPPTPPPPFSSLSSLEAQHKEIIVEVNKVMSKH